MKSIVIILSLITMTGLIIIGYKKSHIIQHDRQHNPSSMLVIGHRGACGYEPENTLSSFQKALDLGVAMIELDVYVCGTGELVVTHDDDVSITTNGHGKVSEMSLHALQQLKVNHTGQIPTLEQVIEFIARRIPINIELKGPHTVKVVAEVIKKYLAQGWQYHDFVISSFDHDQVNDFKKSYPDITTGILFSWKNMPSDIVAISSKYPTNFIGLDVKVVTKDLIQRIHDAGYLVYVWTVNDKVTADMMRAFGVDGIFSNYPDKV